MSQMSSAECFGATISAKLAAICFPPISNVIHLRDAGLTGAYSHARSGVNGLISTENNSVAARKWM
jgi:hypothetical protein